MVEYVPSGERWLGLSLFGIPMANRRKVSCILSSFILPEKTGQNVSRIQEGATPIFITLSVNTNFINAH